MNCIVHGVAKSWTLLSDFHFHFHIQVKAQISAQLQNSRGVNLRALATFPSFSMPLPHSPSWAHIPHKLLSPRSCLRVYFGKTSLFQPSLLLLRSQKFILRTIGQFLSSVRNICVSTHEVPRSVLMVVCHSPLWVEHNWSTQFSADGQLGGF